MFNKGDHVQIWTKAKHTYSEDKEIMEELNARIYFRGFATFISFCPDLEGNIWVVVMNKQGFIDFYGLHEVRANIHEESKLKVNQSFLDSRRKFLC